MLYRSTRGGNARLTPAQAIASGLSPDGGLYVPEEFPALNGNDIREIAEQNYIGRAARIAGLFLDGYGDDELSGYASEAYGHQAFDDPAITPLRELDGNTHFLELWHGPTCAFKDMALRFLPGLLSAAMRKTGTGSNICVLVATSGDTGKAALEGFKDIPGIKVMVFYPHDGVSEIQKLQMTSQEGNNVNATAVIGNFDDAQTGVKAIFSDDGFHHEAARHGYTISSANSINWGRIVPQIAYYVSAYCDLLSANRIGIGEKINFCVPTGNFGNILSAFYARRIGVPINKLICASNSNDVLARFLETGIYDRNRRFYATCSPSMDILVSNNLERLLFEASGGNSREIAGYMASLATGGRYEAARATWERIADVFFGGCCNETDTLSTISRVHERHGYLIDTHTAVAYKVLGDYREKSGDSTPTVVVSTASPFKFSGAVLEALGFGADGGGYELIGKLEEATGVRAPAPLASLAGKLPRFTQAVPPREMAAAAMSFIAT